MCPRSQLTVSCVRAEAQTRTHARDTASHRRTSIAARDRRARPRRWTLRTGGGFPDSRVLEESRRSLARTRPGQAYLPLPSLSLFLGWVERSAGPSVVARRWLSQLRSSRPRGLQRLRASSLSLLLSRTLAGLRDEGWRCSAPTVDAPCTLHSTCHSPLFRNARVGQTCTRRGKGACSLSLDTAELTTSPFRLPVRPPPLAQGCRAMFTSRELVLATKFLRAFQPTKYLSRAVRYKAHLIDWEENNITSKLFF